MVLGHAGTSTSSRRGVTRGVEADKFAGMLMFLGSTCPASYGLAQAASWHAILCLRLRGIST